MKVGIFLKEIPQDLGGAFTFVETVISSLETSKDTSWVVFHYGPKPQSLHLPQVQFIGLGGESFFKKIRNEIYSLKRNQIQPFAAKIERKLRKKIFFPAGSRLDFFARKQKIDLMWFPSPESEWVDCPYIATVWDLEHRVQPYFPEVSMRGEWQARENYFKSLLGRASYIVTGTKTGQDEIVRHYGVSPDRIRLLPHPTPLFALKVGQKYPALTAVQSPYILYPAQFWAHKNHMGLLKAVLWVHKNSSLKPHLVFVGSDKGNKNYLIQGTKDLGLSEFTQFMGFVSRENLIALYQNAALVAYPSLSGPENLPPLEAMALGVPVVAADIAGSREQLGDNVILAQALKPEIFGAALLRVLEDRDLRKNLIEKGKIRAARYTGSEFTHDLLKIVGEFKTIHELGGA